MHAHEPRFQRERAQRDVRRLALEALGRARQALAGLVVAVAARDAEVAARRRALDGRRAVDAGLAGPVKSAVVEDRVVGLGAPRRLHHDEAPIQVVIGDANRLVEIARVRVVDHRVVGPQIQGAEVGDGPIDQRDGMVRAVVEERRRLRPHVRRVPELRRVPDGAQHDAPRRPLAHVGEHVVVVVVGEHGPEAAVEHVEEQRRAADALEGAPRGEERRAERHGVVRRRVGGVARRVVLRRRQRRVAEDRAPRGHGRRAVALQRDERRVPAALPRVVGDGAELVPPVARDGIDGVVGAALLVDAPVRARAVLVVDPTDRAAAARREDDALVVVADERAVREPGVDEVDVARRRQQLRVEQRAHVLEQERAVVEPGRVEGAGEDGRVRLVLRQALEEAQLQQRGDLRREAVARRRVGAGGPGRQGRDGDEGRAARHAAPEPPRLRCGQGRGSPKLQPCTMPLQTPRQRRGREMMRSCPEPETASTALHHWPERLWQA